MLLQATGVAVDGRAILLVGPAGIGKSSLALALIDRGATLIGDDGVTLTCSGRDGGSDKGGGSGHRAPYTLTASPPPNIAGLLEVRGVGLISMPTTSAPVALLVALGEDGDGERLPTALPATDLTGVPVPTFRLAKPDWSTPLRIEAALAHFDTLPLTPSD